MQVDVYDTYATTADGHRMHFDVLVPQGEGARAAEYARRWLDQIGIQGGEVSLNRCNFCHTESVTPEVESCLNNDGYFILQMEGCPAVPA